MPLQEDWIAAELQRLRAQGLERQIRVHQQTGKKTAAGAPPELNLSSNDYLGLARNPQVLRRRQRPCNAGALAAALLA